MPEKAEDEAMAVRRLGFYARCGARDTGYYEHLFDAWFRILVLPCHGAPELSDKDALDALTNGGTLNNLAFAKALLFLCRYVTPILIVIILLNGLKVF